MPGRKNGLAILPGLVSPGAAPCLPRPRESSRATEAPQAQSRPSSSARHARHRDAAAARRHRRRCRRRQLGRRRRQRHARHRVDPPQAGGRDLDRLRLRRHPPRLHRRRRHAAYAGRRDEDPERGQAGDGRDRGQALLQAQRRRLRRRPARRRQERDRRRRLAGRLDVDDAARPQPLHPGEQIQKGSDPQDPGGEAGRRAREAALQGVDTRQLPQQRAVHDRRRPGGGRRAGLGAGAVRQGRLAADARRVGAAGRPAAGAERLQPLRQTEEGQAAPQRGAARDGRLEIHHAGGGRRGQRRAAGREGERLLPAAQGAVRLRLRRDSSC